MPVFSPVYQDNLGCATVTMPVAWWRTRVERRFWTVSGITDDKMLGALCMAVMDEYGALVRVGS